MNVLKFDLYIVSYLIKRLLGASIIPSLLGIIKCQSSHINI